ncbi:hypothetical protein [Streptomyces sp. NBC_01716]|uniref:hypothetical protein n=1 Tax=Streptomyces sp. NBC_01716 TaxID=2975917 RepID=UPI002E32DFCD|nr:hypothetical protein [Streptomyces sp. NBC_01716]
MGLMSWLRGGRSMGVESPAGGGDAVPERGDRGDRVDVRRLVPMQRTVLGQDLVINPAGFQGALSTRRTTALGTPLGHLVSPDAPTGVLHGITSAAPGSPVPSAQRSVEMPLRTTPGGKGAPAGLAMPAAVAPAAAVPAAVSASVSVPEAVPVQRASSAMTSAGTSAVAELPVRQLVGEQPLVPMSTPPQESAEPSSGPEPEPPPPRTPGLGAPLAGLPPTAQRQAAASVPGSGRPEAESVPAVRPPAAPEVPVAAEPPENSPEVDGVPPPVAPLLGDDPLMSAASDHRDGGDASSPSAPLQRSVVVARQRPLPTPTVPLLGDRPLTPRTAVQRDARDGGEPPQLEPPPAPAAVPVRWTTASGPNASAAVPVQRSTVVARESAPLRSVSPAVSATAALPVQRQPRGEPPTPRSVARTGGGAGIPTAGAFAVAAGVAQRMPDGSVVFGSSSASPASSAAGTSRPVVQRDAELSEEPPPPEPAPDSDPEQEPEPASDPQPRATTAGATTAPGQAAAPAVTDELVRALYAPLSRLLKADLRLERERAGFLINTRH